MNSSLGHIIHANDGIFSRAEALDCGETDQSLAAARRAGLVVRLRRGMYAPAWWCGCAGACTRRRTPTPPATGTAST